MLITRVSQQWFHDKSPSWCSANNAYHQWCPHHWYSTDDASWMMNLKSQHHNTQPVISSRYSGTVLDQWWPNTHHRGTWLDPNRCENKPVTTESSRSSDIQYICSDLLQGHCWSDVKQIDQVTCNAVTLREWCLADRSSDLLQWHCESEV